MERISVFDMFKIGVGPSSSHTMGPWRAARYSVHSLERHGQLEGVEQLTVHLYGSLAKTGIGHGTDLAVIMGLQDADPETVDPWLVPGCREGAAADQSLLVAGTRRVPFDADRDLVFHMDESLPYHPNGMRFVAIVSGQQCEQIWYSVGGGFVLCDGVTPDSLGDTPVLPYPIDTAAQLLAWCEKE